MKVAAGDEKTSHKSSEELQADMKEYGVVFSALTVTLHVEQSRTLLAKAKGGITAEIEMQQQDKPNTCIARPQSF